MRNFLFLSIRTLWPDTPCVLSKRFFTSVEDRFYLEQYDEPQTTFDRGNGDDAASYAKVVNRIHKINLHSINLNFIKVQRSDSMEQLLETINAQSSELRGNEDVTKAFKSMDGMINKFTLRLNDPSKEEMYN